MEKGIIKESKSNIQEDQASGNKRSPDSKSKIENKEENNTEKAIEKRAEKKPEKKKKSSLKDKKKHPPRQIECFIGLFILLIASFGLWWAEKNFGSVSFDEIVFHLQMPLKGTSSGMIEEAVVEAVLPAIGIWLLVLALYIMPVKRKSEIVFRGEKRELRFGLIPVRLPRWLFRSGLIVWFAAVLFLADSKFSFMKYVQSQMQRSHFIEEEYISPKDVAITFPEKKRNLICIYIESAESSTQDYANGGLFPVNYIPELTTLAKENTSFSQSDLIEGAAMTPATAWTIAGLTAETSGLPLKLPPNYNNVMSKYEEFLPGAISLGEILEDNGYHNYFMAGSDFSFGGRRTYFTQHGNYEVFDLLWARKTGRLPEDYYVFWGFEDMKLFSYAKEQLTEIAAKDEPFNFSLLTVDTHTPNGYVCDLCGHAYRDQYANVWACASRQIAEFVEWCQQQDFYENTTIYLCGDHVSMNPNFYGTNTKDDYVGEAKRKVYNCFVNAAVEPVREKNRVFTTLDMFPSVIASIGGEIEGERLGLGTNLFSDEQTLSEKYGLAYVFEELEKKSSFYDEEILYPK